MSTPLWAPIEALESRLLLDAAAVYLDLEVNETAGTFQLFADATADNNGGIAGYSIPLSGVTTVRNLAPRGFDANVQTNRGFTLAPAWTAGGDLFAGQNISDADSVIYGIGQTSGTFNVVGGTGVPWGAHVLLADGTFTASQTPAINFADAGVNVFASSSQPTPIIQLPSNSILPLPKVEMDRAVLSDAPPDLSYNSISPADLETRYSFSFDVDAGNTVAGGTLKTPDQTVYTLTRSLEGTAEHWGYQFVADALGNLSHFTDGNYTLTLNYDGGRTTATTVSFTDPDNGGAPIAAPTQQPHIVSPVMGDFGVGITPTIQWSAVTDVAVTAIRVEVKEPLTDHVVDSATLPRTSTTWHPAGLATNKVYLVTLSFASEHSTDPQPIVHVTGSKSTSTGAVFNTKTGLLSPIAQVAIDKGVTHDSGGDAMYQFNFTLAGTTSALSFASFQTPTGDWYTIDQHTSGQWYFQASSADAGDLADFTDGTYTLWIDRGLDTYATTTFDFVDPDTQAPLTQPTQAPAMLTPAADATGVSTSPHFTWGAVTDPSINGITLVVYEPTASTNEIRQDLPRTATSFQRAAPLGYDTWYEWQLGFSNSATASNDDSIDFLVTKYQTATARFTTVLREVDLTGHLGTSTLPATAVENRAIVGTLGVVVTNEGNAAAIVGQRVTIQVLARNEADPTHPITLATLANLSISALPIGSSKTFSVPVNYAGGLSAGQYTIEALLVPVALTDSDPDNNLLTLNGQGQTIGMNVQASFFDLQPTLSAGVIMPWVTVSGAGGRLVVPVKVTNAGNTALPLLRTINITLSARPDSAEDDSEDVLLKTLTNQSVSGLAANKYKIFSLTASLPPGLADDHYVLVAKVDTGNSVAETNEGNNEAETARSIDVIKGYVDLTGSFGLVTLPPAVLTGSTLLSKRVTVNVRNAGTVPLPLGQTASVVLYARPTVGAPVELARNNNVLLSLLAAGTTRPVVLTFNVPASLAAGTYDVEAVITPNGDLEENDDSNNEATLNANGQPVRLVSSVSFVDVTARLGTSYLPASVVAGNLVRSTAQVIVTNSGNAALPVGQVAEIVLRARNEGDGTFVTLGTYHNYSLSGMAAGTSRTASIVVNPVGGLPAGAYHLEAEVSPNNLPQDDSENNTTSTNAAGQEIDILAAAPFVDLRPKIGATALLPARTIISGDATRITLPVVVQNIGNSPLALGATIDVEVYARSVEGGDETLVTTLSNQRVSLLAANASRTFSAIVTLPRGLEADDYVLMAKVDTSNDIADESLENNNTVATARSLHVARGFVDLAGTFSTVLLPAQVNAGQKISGSVRVSLTNLGRVALPAGQQVVLTLKARPAGGDGSTDIELAHTLNLPVSLLAPGTPRLLTIAVNKLTGLPAGNYTLVAEITAVQPLTEESSGNNVVTLNAAGSEPALTVV